MNTVYEIRGPTNDLESGFVETSGIGTVPSFECTACGYKMTTHDVWYASLMPKTKDAFEFVSNLPKQVSEPADYNRIVNELKQMLHTTVKLPPGSIIGAKAIDVRAHSDMIGGLTGKKLKQGMDFIAAGCSYLISQRVHEHK